MNTENKYLVGSLGGQIVVGLAMRTARMSKEDTLLYAAWLVALATSDPEKDFTPILNEVMNT